MVSLYQENGSFVINSTGGFRAIFIPHTCECTIKFDISSSDLIRMTVSNGLARLAQLLQHDLKFFLLKKETKIKSFMQILVQIRQFYKNNFISSTMEHRTEDRDADPVTGNISEPTTVTVIRKNNYTLEPSLFLIVFSWSLTCEQS